MSEMTYDVCHVIINIILFFQEGFLKQFVDSNRKSMSRGRNYMMDVSENHHIWCKSHTWSWHIAMPSFKLENLYFNFCSKGKFRLFQQSRHLCNLFVNIANIKSSTRESHFSIRNIFFNEKLEIQIGLKIFIRISGYWWVNFFNVLYF